MAGGGVGEAMLISAVTGAGTAAVTGGDPLKGALLGAATGGIGHGIAGAGAAGGAGATGTAAATSTGLEAGLQAVPDAATLADASNLALTAPNVGISAPATSTSGAYTDAFTLPMDSGSGFKVTDPSMAQNFAPNVGASQTGAASNPMFPRIAEMSKSGYFYPGLGAASSLIGAGPETKMPGEEEYDGPLSRFNYDPDRYRPYRAASGGLMDTEPARRMAAGGLGSYSDGGQMLKGPGDGMSDDIPASIEDKQPARLADGEFVVPADVVSGIGNGSTDAGAEALYAMLDRVRKARTGRTEQAPEIDAQRMMPA
jgi:hypothetical protein